MLAVVAAVIMFIVVAPVAVRGDNMSPALRDGDIVIIAKNTYSDVRLPGYGDIVVFKRSFAPNADSSDRRYRAARVAGLPGDIMEAQGGELKRNGEAVRTGVGELEKKEVAEGELYVLNDSGGDALDSRDPAVSAELGAIRGKVVFRIWPLDRFGGVG
jgi:signal peptidase I